MHISHYSYRLADSLRGMGGDFLSHRLGSLLYQSYNKEPKKPKFL
jgi:hypothetical protein